MNASLSITSGSGSIEDIDVDESYYAGGTYKYMSSKIDKYPPYNHNLHFVFLSILSAYIPIIVISSSLVVAAVIFVKQLHNTHNIILLSISMTDLVLALVVIPIHVFKGVPEMQDILISYPLLDPILGTVVDAVNTIAISFLTLLGLDTFLQITYPLVYRRHHANKKAIACVTTIAAIDVFIAGVFLGIRIYCRAQKQYGYEIRDVVGIELIQLRFYQILYGIMLALCFILGLYVRWVSWKRVQGLTDILTMVLLMLFIIFYSPTLRLLYGYRELFKNKSTLEKWRYIAHVSRYMSSVTNGMFIYLSRPVYKKAFRYFLKTCPLHWKNVEQVFAPRYSTTLDKYVKTPPPAMMNDVNRPISSKTSLSSDHLLTDVTVSGVPSWLNVSSIEMGQLSPTKVQRIE